MQRLFGKCVVMGWVGMLFVVGGLGCAAKEELRLRLGVGETYRLNYLVDQDLTMNIPGVGLQEMEQVVGMGMTFSVKDVDGEGNMRIGVVYHGMKMKNSAAGLDFDSARGDKGEGPLVGGFAALVGKGFEFRLSSRGEVLEIKGAREMLEGMLNEIDVPDTAKEALRNQYVSQFGEESIRSQLRQTMGFFPEEGVGVGDAWRMKRTVKSVFEFTTDDRFVLKEVKDGVAVIGVESVIDSTPGGKASLPGVTKVDAKGKQAGEIRIDVATGWILGSKVKQDLDVTMTMKMGDQTMEMEMGAKSVITLKPVDGK